MGSTTTKQTVKSKRIAKNSMLLFIRMFVIMIINLYAVRIIIHGLGVSDYGTFNAVAGIVLSSSVLTASLAIAIQRFYSHAMGEQAYERLSEIFSASMNIIFIVSMMVVVLLESLGLWFLNTQLTIPADRLVAANWVYQFSLLSFLLSLIQLPYTAAIFSHEDMGYFALISFLECVLRLAAAIWISKVMMDGLIFYGAGLLAVAVVVFLLYWMVGRHHYSECHYRKVTNRTVYKELISFSGWTMYGTLAGVASTQGNTLLLNVFFGPITTAAFAISLQISHGFQALSNSIILAFRPAMIKTYAEQDHVKLNSLFDASNKFLLYLLLSVSVPIFLEIRTIFSLWLGPVSEEAILFARLFIIYIILIAMHNPITTIVQATGHVKKYTLWVETIMLACLLLSYIAFKLGGPSYFIVLSLIAVSFMAHGLRLICLHQLYPSFKQGQYLAHLIIPGIVITILTFTAALALHHYFDSALIRCLCIFIISPILTIGLAYALGTNKMEKEQISLFGRQLIKRIRQ